MGKIYLNKHTFRHQGSCLALHWHPTVMEKSWSFAQLKAADQLWWWLVGGGLEGGTQKWPCNRQVQAAHQEERQKNALWSWYESQCPRFYTSPPGLTGDIWANKNDLHEKIRAWALRSDSEWSSDSDSATVTGAGFQILFMMHKYIMVLWVCFL